MADETTGLLLRTRRCGEVTEEDAREGREVVLTGWVHKRRDLGQLIFIELRDISGMVQIVFDPSSAEGAHGAAEALRQEYVVGIRGKVVPREQPNPNHPTGQVEVRAAECVLHNRAEAVPFPVADETEAHEEARLTHRYVDLRRPSVQAPLLLRHRLSVAARRVLDGSGFVELETPMLTRSTPEGARDYLVPSRVHPGQFYALPQSPQLFKQLLMIAGFDRYYQFARCFRDEDLRADRQPEFTQIDIEMSFVTPDAVYAAVEPMVAAMFEEVGVKLEFPIPRMDYAEAMDRFGTDRPDTRFALELRDAGPACVESGFKVFQDAIDAGGTVRGIAVPGGAAASRKRIDEWTEWAKQAGAGGLVWIKLADDGAVTSSALKILGQERCERIAEAVGAGKGDAALLAVGPRDRCNRVLGTLRLKLAAALELIPADRRDLLWVEGFPLLDWDDDEKRWMAIHHPFTAPRWDEVDRLDSEPGAVRSQAYDMVLNGTEIGGGSIRIHRQDVQQRVFKTLGIGEEEAEAKFGFLLRALAAGAPPHGGIAFGFDRIAAMLSGSESLRDVIAFPKTTSAACLMTGSPSAVDSRQLAELGLRLAQTGKVKK